MPQKTELFITTGVRTSNSTRKDKLESRKERKIVWKTRKEGEVESEY
jgi:hypothetical protein